MDWPVQMDHLSPAMAQEMEGVRRRLVGATDALHPTVTEFVRTQEGTEPSLLALVILAAAFPPEDSASAGGRRVALAAALELLYRGLDIHKLLVVPLQEDRTPDRSLVGGTVLAGDLCFSRAAALAAESESPEVVAIFARLLQRLSEAHLRRLFGHSADGFDEAQVLLHHGILAGAVLAGLDGPGRTELARQVSRWLTAAGPARVQWTLLPPYQRARWRAVFRGLPYLSEVA